ncbi:MAG: hypothetical protein QMB63_08990 [Clostridiaceae bacterium]
MAFNLKIVTAEKILIDEEVTSFKTSNDDGEFQILTDHSPLISLTVKGLSEYITPNGERKTIETEAGVLKFKNNSLLLMTSNDEELLDQEEENESESEDDDSK